MKRFPISALLAAAILGAASAPIALQAAPQGAGGPPPAHMEGPRGPRGMIPPPVPGMEVAGRLAAAEVYLGITDEQGPAWRAYCAALIDFLEPAPPQPGDEPQLMAERMARDTLQRGDKAQTLLDATTALRAELDPAQIERMVRSEPRPGRHGMGPHGMGPRDLPPPAEAPDAADAEN